MVGFVVACVAVGRSADRDFDSAGQQSIVEVSNNHRFH